MAKRIPKQVIREKVLNDGIAGLRQFVKAHRMKHQRPGSGFAEFERGLHGKMMELERSILAEELARADVDQEQVWIEGVPHRRVLRAEETYMTAAGEVRVMRTLYKDRTDPDAQSLCPMELRAGILEGFWSPVAAEQSLWVVAQMTPQMGQELFGRIGNMTPSKASLDRLPKRVAERWEDNRVELEGELRETMTVPREARTMVISLDGVYAPMNDTNPVATRQAAADSGKIAKGPAGYREVGCATLAFCDVNGEMLSTIRFGRMPETKKATLKEMLLAEVARARELRPELVQVAIADAVEDNWEFLSGEFPKAVQIVDFFHAAEHLSDAIAAVYGDGTVQARRRASDLRFVLREQADGVDIVIRALTYLKKKHPGIKKVAQTAAYFRKHRARMKYAEHRARGLPIGSGVVEAACKTLVTQRMKHSGMRWGQLGGQAILNPRGWSQSERFDQAWALIAATYQVEVTVVNNVIPLRPKAA